MNLKNLLLSASMVLVLKGFVSGAAVNWTITDHIHIGGEGGWDYLTIDQQTSRLFVSHAKQVVVIDLKTQSIIGSIPANGVHGIALAPELKRGFISNGEDNTVTVFDLTNLQVLASLPVGKKPDAICYEPTTQRVFAFDGDDNTATVIDAEKVQVIGTIPLGGRPEFAGADGHGSVFDALEDKGQILKINPSSLAIVARWSLPDGTEPSALAIDTVNERLFVGCGNQTMKVLDGVSGKVIATLPIGKGVDACAYDPVAHRVFASCGDGTMTVVQQKDKDTYAVAEKVITEPRARTMAFDPTTGTAYLPIAKFGPLPAATPEHPKPRPPVLPDTLELLVVKASSP